MGCRQHSGNPLHRPRSDANGFRKAVLLGAPLDATVSFRPGCRFGPERIRTISRSLEEYSFPLRASLDTVDFEDAGDIEMPLGNPAKSLDEIERVCTEVFRDGRLLFMLGGEHLVTVGAVRAAKKFYPNLHVLQLDAHADLRDEFFGEKLSHATVMRRVLEEVGPGRLHQIGVRSAVAEEAALMTIETNYYQGSFLDALRIAVRNLEGKPVYLTVDIDVVDPAYAPGTGSPEPGGITSAELLEGIRVLGGTGQSGINLVGMDVVEVSPAQDPSDITSLLAARVVRDSLIIFAGGK
ncbi:MAG TPA: agmatinase [Firmicutes bacterium]|nr:agmatinase [Bacillota bacterium]